MTLPAEPAWKRDYSGSVRRLAGDGVDTSLASLFIHAARPLAPGAEGAPNTRIAVELDGDQHLADPAAYRRDRRKDLLSQENSYLVLRFLAQDVGRDLDRVLDTILRALARRPRLLSSSNTG